MPLRRITVDNSVRDIPIWEKYKETDIKPKKIKTGSLPGKQNKKTSQNIKNFLNSLSAKKFEVLK